MTTLPEQAAEYVQPSATAGTRELCAEHDAQHLGLAPEREGQPRMMTIIDRAQDDETGHWYSPEAVREMLAAERKRCATIVRRAWADYGCTCSDASALADIIERGAVDGPA